MSSGCILARTRRRNTTGNNTQHATSNNRRSFLSLSESTLSHVAPRLGGTSARALPTLSRLTPSPLLPFRPFFPTINIYYRRARLPPLFFFALLRVLVSPISGTSLPLVSSPASSPPRSFPRENLPPRENRASCATRVSPRSELPYDAAYPQSTDILKNAKSLS